MAEKVAIIAPMSPPCTAPLPVATATSTDGGCLAMNPSNSFFFASSSSMVRDGAGRVNTRGSCACWTVAGRRQG